MKLRVINGGSAATNPPSAATDGVKLWKVGQSADGLLRGTDRANIFLWADVTASQVGSVRIRFWGYDGANWFPLGVGAEGTKGELDAESTIGEPDPANLADKIRHSEVIEGLSALERLYAQVISPTQIVANTLNLELRSLRNERARA